MNLPGCGFAWAIPAPALFPRPRSTRRAPQCNLSEPSPSTLSTDKLSLWWPDGTPALSSISLSIPPGTLAMLTGPNACGKSTLLRALRNFYIPDLGSVTLPTPTAFVWQDPGSSLIFPSVFANVAISIPETDTRHPGHWRARISNGAFVEEQVYRRLAAVGFDDPVGMSERKTRELSGGEKQRVAVAAALAMQPRCILFDEVTASMDAVNRAALMRAVPRLVKEENVAALW